jgi:diguanylate cyclase (GGDEF)-like protein
VGDRALRAVADAIRGQLREGDLLARMGGEEFLVLLPVTDQAAASLLAERLRLTLAGTSIEENGEAIYLPASFGVAELQSNEDFTEWYRRVDSALYQAKNQGRNSMFASL